MLQKIRYKIVFNRSGKLNSRGEGLLEVECSQNGRRKYFTTHIYARPENYSKGFIIGTENASGLNYTLCKKMQEIEAIEIEFIKNGTAVTLSMLKESYKMYAIPSAKINDFGTEVIAQSDKKKLTKMNYQTLLNNLEKFRKNTILSDIDYQYLIAYEKWLRDSGIAHNTKVSRLRLLRSLLNEAKRRGAIQVNPFDNFKIQQMVSKKGYLTYEDLHNVEQIKLEGREDIVRDGFLIACYTGLRFSDVISLRKNNIVDGWIKKQMIKTTLTVDIPINDLFDGKMVKILEKYKGNIENISKKLPSNAVVNKTLKSILGRLKIDPKITFHSSRHTFATLLCQDGVSITTVQKLLGHTKLQTTQIYSEINRETIENDLNKINKKKKNEKNISR